MPSFNLRNALKRNPNRLTLKQRTAALKATAGRVLRRRLVEAAPVVAGADPRLVALVGEWQEARRMLNDPNLSDDAPGLVAMGERDSDLQLEIYRFPARSVADLHAKIPVFPRRGSARFERLCGAGP